jgi:hypothetical protein
MTTYQTVFGGNQISPALDSYNSFTITALNSPIQLVWPQETAPNGNLASNIVEIAAASTAAGGLILPNAELVSVGDFVLFNNLSSFNQEIYSYGGAVIISAIAPGAVYFLYLQSNSTQAGTWIGFQYGAATSAPNAAALAGAGLLATGTTLSQDIPVSTYTTSPVTITVNNRAQLINWGAGAGSGIINLPASATAGANFYIQVKNSSTSTLQINPAGSDNINGTVSPGITLQPNDSAFVVTDGTGNWYTIGLGTTQPVFFNYQAISVTGISSPIVLGTTAGTSLNKIAYKFTGVLTANMIVQLPAYTQTYWINNQTTGAYTLTFQVGYPTAAGTTQAVQQTQAEILYTDGSNVINAVSGSNLSNPVTVAQGGTGATTPGAALSNLGGSSIGIAVFEATSNGAAQAAIGAPSFSDAMIMSNVC